jgi:hypothetical protein
MSSPSTSMMNLGFIEIGPFFFNLGPYEDLCNHF